MPLDLITAAPPQSYLVNAADFARFPPKQPVWLVKDLVLQATNGWIGASAKIGKSFLALDLLLSCALGEAWLGQFPIERPLTVVLIEEEDSAWRVYERLRRLCNARRVAMPDTLHLAIRQGIQIDDASFESLALELADLAPDLCVWDVFNRLHTADEGRRDQMMPILKRIDRLRDTVGCSNLIVHHSRKPATTGPDMATGGQRLRGLSEFWGWAENSLYLSRHKHRVTIEPESKDAIVDPFVVHLDDKPDDHDDARRWIYDGEAAAKLSAAEKTRQKIVAALEAGPLDKQALALAVGVTPQTVHRYLRDLVADKVVDTPESVGGRGQRRLYWLVSNQPEASKTGSEEA